MTERKWRWRSLILPRCLVTPRGFALLAAKLAVLFLVCHAFGLRRYTCVLCGQSPTGDPADVTSSALGCFYILAYGLFVVGSPTLALASVIFRGLQWLAGRRIGSA